MTRSFGSISIGTRLAVIATGVATMLISLSALAQEPAPGPHIDPNVLNLAIEARTKRPASQATEAERSSVLNELRDIYRVTDSPRGTELAADSRMAAQLELQRRAMLYNALAKDFVARNPASEEEIQSRYKEQVTVSPPQEFKARHILVESQAAAMGLITNLQRGADFVELARAKSTGPSGPTGGDLGWFSAQAMVKPFSDAVALLGDGEFTTAPVQTQFGWHVILREDSRDGTPPPLESVRDVIKNQIEENKFKEYVNGLR